MILNLLNILRINKNILINNFKENISKSLMIENKYDIIIYNIVIFFILFNNKK